MAPDGRSTPRPERDLIKASGSWHVWHDSADHRSIGPGHGAGATPWLQVGGSQWAIAGLAACGIRHHPGDFADRIRWAARLQRAFERARQSGWISLRLADEICVHGLLLHPAEVFGNLWWDAERTELST